jgi:chemotaxis protein methyltransferase CheR
MSAETPVTEDDFRRLTEFLYRRTGMVLTEAKRYFVERRLTERMTAVDARSFAEYFARLRNDFADEIEHFINAFTVNETYFYREDDHFRCLIKDLLRLRIAKSSVDTLRIWSIPCSTGEEPYSIAIWLLENWPSVDSYNIEIVGSDIDTRVLEAARQGLYGERALMRVTPELAAKYFRRTETDQWQLIDDIRESVQLSRVNVLDVAETGRQGRFDVIFCRNMLIYFDEASRRRAAENLYECLLPGGFICLGHTESMSRISSLFEVCRFDDAVVYQRATAQGGRPS